MSIMRVTIKGQVTVPKALRDRFGLTTETEVEFREERGKLLLVKKKPDAVISSIRGRVKRLPVGRDVDDYIHATRGG